MMTKTQNIDYRKTTFYPKLYELRNKITISIQKAERIFYFKTIVTTKENVCFENMLMSSVYCFEKTNEVRHSVTSKYKYVLRQTLLLIWKSEKETC